MTSLAEIRTGLADTIAQGTGLRCHRYPPRSLNAPAGFPAARSGSTDDMDDTRKVTVAWWVVVALRTDNDHDVIDAALDGLSVSVPAAIDADPTLGLDGVDAMCGNWVEGEVDVAGATYWGVRFDVSVIYSPDEEVD